MSRHQVIPHGRARAFTLTEMLVATVVLIAVLLAVGKIFSTTSRVTGLGQANAAVLQEILPISRQVRRDFADIVPKGMLVIRCVKVPNDINGDVLLNPNRPADAYLRFDHLVFFRDETQGTRTFSIGGTADQRVQSTTSRIYYGHAFSLGDAGRAAETPASLPSRGYDVDPDETIYPWSSGDFDGVWTNFDPDSGGLFDSNPDSEPIEAEPPDARRLLFARQHVALLDEYDNDPQIYGFNTLTAVSLFVDDNPLGFPWSSQIRDGRVDAAAEDLTALRRALEWIDPGQFPGDGEERRWRGSGSFSNDNGQMAIIAEQLLYYPRAERKGLAPSRIDQALTNHVISSGCSEVRIDWTFAEDTGDVREWRSDPDDSIGVLYGPRQPWFGLEDEERRVYPYGEGDGVNDDERPWELAETICPDDIERFPQSGWPDRVEVYEAVFGPGKTVKSADGIDCDTEFSGYTPWPSAVRITLTLHDPAVNLENGRTCELVVSIPEQAR